MIGGFLKRAITFEEVHFLGGYFSLFLQEGDVHQDFGFGR